MCKLTIDDAIKHAADVAKRKYMEGMLCHANPDDGKLDDCIKCGREYEQLVDWLEELKEYKKLETESKLIKSPIGIGDVVYTNMKPCGWYLREANKPYKAKVVFIGVNGVDNFFNVQYESGNMWEFKFSDIGNIVFLNPHDAIVSDYKLKMEDK